MRTVVEGMIIISLLLWTQFCALLWLLLDPTAFDVPRLVLRPYAAFGLGLFMILVHLGLQRLGGALHANRVRKT